HAHAMVVGAQEVLAGRELEAGVLQPLQEPGQDPAQQRHVRHQQVRPGEPALRPARHRRLVAHDRGSTMTLPPMVWCAMPQYSWHAKKNSPSRSNRATTREIWPGISMTLTLADGMNSPWITSRLVPMNVTREPTGTRISFGVNDQTCET